MNIKKIIPFLLIAFWVFTGCQTTEQKAQPKAKYVFYFIGDGVSLPQLSLTEAYLAQVSGKHGMQQLHQSKLDAHGWFYAHADNRFITGSAAVGTALATGHKTSINTIGKSADHAKNYESIACKAKNTGMKVGIISTVSIDHATPAAFYAHSEHRGHYYKIGQQLFESGFDLFAGGGLKEPKGENGDKPDLYQLENDIKILRQNSAFRKTTKKDLPFYFAHERLQNDAAMPFAIDMTAQDVSLQELTGKSIELLDNEDGFFLMVEGGKIDWACHANDAASMIHGMLDFDKAVGEALKFAEKHPQETLIVVLGDHETGGLTLGNEEMEYETRFEILQHQKMSFERLVHEIKPLIDNRAQFSEALDFVGKHLQLGTEIPLNKKDKASLRKAWNASVKYDTYKVELLYGTVQKFLFEALRMLNTKAGVGWTSTAHTGLPVVVHAHGAGAGQFEGILDNTDIPKIMWQTMANE